MNEQSSSMNGQSAVISVSAMARLVGLSRARFYSLMEQGVFPMPLYVISTKRPFYNAELQERCRVIRQSGIGWNGDPVLFYSSRNNGTSSRMVSAQKSHSQKTPLKPKIDPRIEAIIGSLEALGLSGLKPSQVVASIASCFSNGAKDINDGEVIAVLFRHFREQDNAE